MLGAESLQDFPNLIPTKLIPPFSLAAQLSKNRCGQKVGLVWGKRSAGGQSSPEVSNGRAFAGRAAQLVRERNWHPSQQIQELADDNLELSLTLNSLEEMVPWILSWGKDCEVVSPVKLQRKVRSISA